MEEEFIRDIERTTDTMTKKFLYESMQRLYPDVYECIMKKQKEIRHQKQLIHNRKYLAKEYICHTCGLITTNNHKAKHLKSKKHQRNIQMEEHKGNIP